MGFSLLGSSYNIHPSTRSLDGISPLGGSRENPPLMEFLPLRGSYNIHPSTRRLMRFFPLGGSCVIPLLWIFLTQWIVYVHSTDEIFPTQKCQYRLAYRLFSAILREPKLSVVGLSHSESLTLLQGFSPQSPRLIFR